MRDEEAETKMKRREDEEDLGNENDDGGDEDDGDGYMWRSRKRVDPREYSQKFMTLRMLMEIVDVDWCSYRR